MKNVFVVGVLLMAAASDAGAVCYVNSWASAEGTGSSWSSPMLTLDEALKNSACSEIHVAQGVYTPPDRRIVTDYAQYYLGFAIPPGTKLIGGFKGTEPNPDVRLPLTYQSILSGDIDHNDANALTTNIDWSVDDIRGANAVHVLSIDAKDTPVTSSTVIDGFIITGGDGAVSINAMFDGGGLVCYGNYPGSKCNPKLTNLWFLGNLANSGGAIANYGESGESSPEISNCRFHGNTASGGGAIYNRGFRGISSPTILNSTFDSNSAYFGGAIYNIAIDGQAITFIQNTTFSGNELDSWPDNGGTVIFNEGRDDGIAVVFLDNVTSASNTNQGTSAFKNIGIDGFSEIEATNSILWDSESGTEVVDTDASSEFNHTIMRDGCPATADWCSKVYASDPQLGLLFYNGGNLPNMLPAATSIAIDNGSDRPTDCPATDERGVARPQGSHCDIGAVERQSSDRDN